MNPTFILNPANTITSNHHLNATDLANMAICKRKLYLKYYGNPDEQIELSHLDKAIQAQGEAHERTVVDPSRFTPITIESWAEGVEQTLAAMRAGVKEIYQGMLAINGLRGQPDLLIRKTGKSALGAYHYRPIEIKLGRRMRNSHQYQVKTYLYILEHLQQVETYGELYLGVSRRETITLDVAEFEDWLKQAKQVVIGQVEPAPYLAGHCTHCVWQEHCFMEAHKSYNLTLLPHLTKEMYNSLVQAGITSLDTLAQQKQTDLLKLKGIGPKTAPQLINRATAFVKNKAIPIKPPTLPNEPVEIYLDFESVQHTQWGEPATCYYLLGWVTRQRVDNRQQYYHCTAESIDDEAEIWAKFLDQLSAMPGPIYHYSGYERQALNQLNNRYGFDDRVPALLDRCVDLLVVVRNHVALPITSYSLKHVANWLGYRWTTEIQTGADSMVMYNQWLNSQDRYYLETVQQYNRHDCEAMILIKDWLMGLY